MQDYDDLDIFEEYIDNATGRDKVSPELKALYEVVEAVEGLEQSMVQMFNAHDYSLRAEVESINSKVYYLLGLVGLVGAAILVWPRFYSHKTDK